MVVSVTEFIAQTLKIQDVIGVEVIPMKHAVLYIDTVDMEDVSAFSNHYPLKVRDGGAFLFKKYDISGLAGYFIDDYLYEKVNGEWDIPDTDNSIFDFCSDIGMVRNLLLQDPICSEEFKYLEDIGIDLEECIKSFCRKADLK